eukprot:Clim_evm94s236 gene=Clim_evmTU94s236
MFKNLKAKLGENALTVDNLATAMGMGPQQTPQQASDRPGQQPVVNNATTTSSPSGSTGPSPHPSPKRTVNVSALQQQLREAHAKNTKLEEALEKMQDKHMQKIRDLKKQMKETTTLQQQEPGGSPENSSKNAGMSETSDSTAYEALIRDLRKSLQEYKTKVSHMESTQARIMEKLSKEAQRAEVAGSSLENQTQQNRVLTQERDKLRFELKASQQNCLKLERSLESQRESSKAELNSLEESYQSIRQQLAKAQESLGRGQPKSAAEEGASMESDGNAENDAELTNERPAVDHDHSKELQDRVFQLENRNRQLHSKFVRLQTLLKSHIEDVRDIQKDKVRLTGQLKVTRNQHKELHVKMQTIQQQHAQVKSLVVDHGHAFQTQVRAHKLSADDIGHEGTVLHNSIASLSQTVTNTVRQLQQNLKVSQQQAETAAMSQHMDSEMQNTLEEKESQVEELQTALNNSQQQTQQLRQELKDQDAANVEEMEKIVHERDNLKIKLSQAQSEAQATPVQADDSEEVLRLQAKVKELEETSEGQKAETKEAKNRNRDLEDHLQEAQNGIERLKRKLETTEKLSQENTERMNRQMVEQKDALNAEITQLQARIRELDEGSLVLQNQSQNSARTVQELKDRILAVQGETELAVRERDELQDELGLVRQELEDNKRHHEENLRANERKVAKLRKALQKELKNAGQLPGTSPNRPSTPVMTRMRRDGNSSQGSLGGEFEEVTMTASADNSGNASNGSLQDVGSPPALAVPTSPSAGGSKQQDMDREYLRFVIFKYMCAHGTEAQQLSKAITTLMQFTPDQIKEINAAQKHTGSGLMGYIPKFGS